MNQEKIKAELGDVLWYLAAVAKEYNLKLSDVAQYNMDKLKDRAERGVLRGSGDNR
jgi:NTP pyrophosphatase (non-canonical NTP hydrolase)